MRSGSGKGEAEAGVGKVGEVAGFMAVACGRGKSGVDEGFRTAPVREREGGTGVRTREAA